MKPFNNNSTPELMLASIGRGEAELNKHGALLVKTGKFTGRNNEAKRIVKTEANSDAVWWDNNNPMHPSDFYDLKANMMAYVSVSDVFCQQLRLGTTHGFNVEVKTTLAWHSLFIQHMLNVPSKEELKAFIPEINVLCVHDYPETIIAIDLDCKQILVGGSGFSGEMKKAIFTVANYHLPQQDILPMHCSATVSSTDDEDVALLFGLSGTGKTTLSSSPDRILIGDDEHGWGKDGVFNFEGGCYAKTQGLTPISEPEIFTATQTFGSVIENMVCMDGTGDIDYNDDSISPNSRCAYPLSSLSNVSTKPSHPHPTNIFMLSYDAYGVLPPISKLDVNEAVKWFLLGYTSKMAGTEEGITEPQATFSPCFGAPFMPRKPAVYGEMLKELITTHSPDVWLLNTGIVGDKGKRIPLSSTRSLLNKALNGEFNDLVWDREFNFQVPKGIEANDYWSDEDAYRVAKKDLLAMI